jgi:hypothetical protein
MADETPADRWRLVRGTNLKPEDRHVLLTLFLFQGNNGSAFCKQETLADEIGVDPRSIRRSLKRLNAAGIVRSEWKGLNGVGVRHYAIDFQKLRTFQRDTGRTPASYLEFEGRTPASAMVGHQRPDTQDTSVLQEDPLNIQGTSTTGNSPNSMARPARKSKADTDAKLIAFCVNWNNWHSAGIVRSQIRDTNSPGKTICDAWNRSQRDPDQRGRLENIAALKAAIQASQKLLKPGGWFDAAGLIGGKNSNHRWYAEQLIAGTYRDKTATGAPDSPEAETAWQNVLDAIQKHSRFKPEQIEADVGKQAWRAVKSIGLKKIDEASKVERQELKPRFIQAFKGTEAA